MYYHDHGQTFSDLERYEGDRNFEGLVKKVVDVIKLIIAQIEIMIKSQFIGDKCGIDEHPEVTSAWQADDIN